MLFSLYHTIPKVNYTFHFSVLQYSTYLNNLRASSESKLSTGSLDRLAVEKAVEWEERVSTNKQRNTV